ncbi:non-canonical purine NTP pyrophosphatase [Virgibacillus profundi]|uniref:dITP/XTP pyrophosphatase n=1 Tax=Virgibacillus profundi TaxID=2024555 RepID=A0A2A2I806_9BACI|nr:XTP/dITP diphosphatase [Virgibacillus profundi]PAV27712.1 non-canonical purine NTP pyrophosphatase [Virgibacillus profundi]PXY51867.1 XTP/dITP diphosphatase [Virgibacillus profundi]
MKQIVIATGNKGKAKEFKEFFADYKIDAVSLLDLDKNIPDVEETGTTFEQNAALKAEQIAALLDTPVLADDSGLIIDALDGRPGIFSARYAGGESKSDKKNIEKVLAELKTIPKEKRTARFICVLAIAIPGKETIFKTGYCEGSIGFEEKGENGFGYDPIFIPEDYTKSMAELSPNEKNSISHRRNAIIQLEKWIKAR